MDGRYVPSLLAAIGDVIARHLVETGFISAEMEEVPAARAQVAIPGEGAAARLAQCPKCGVAALVRQEGCAQCTNCGYSKCG